MQIGKVYSLLLVIKNFYILFLDFSVMGVRWGKRFVFYWDENFVLPESCLADPCVAVDDSGCLVLLPGLLETSGRTSEAVRRARLKG